MAAFIRNKRRSFVGVDRQVQPLFTSVFFFAGSFVGQAVACMEGLLAMLRRAAS
ncbi:MAG: hypothetical protein JWP96_1466 [Polaromonas sp.]|nr:hypothetical protein [Polaromonas sp.]